MRNAWRARTDAMRDDAGSSLAEVLVAMSLMMIAIVGISGALMSAVMIAGSQHESSTTQAVLASYHEKIMASGTYVPCATPSSYAPSAVGFTVPEGFTVQVKTVSFWNGNAVTPAFAPMPGCTLLTDPGLQDLVLSASSNISPLTPEEVHVLWRGR